MVLIISESCPLNQSLSLDNYGKTKLSSGHIHAHKVSPDTLEMPGHRQANGLQLEPKPHIILAKTILVNTKT